LTPPDEALARGETGEIGIGGIGVAEGYFNRPELTAARFIEDFLALPNNPSGRIYRTGDLGRINEDGEIEFLGRIDTQIKLRGHRIELTEIESVLLEIPEIAQVAATTFEPAPGAPELVAYYSVKHGLAARAGTMSVSIAATAWIFRMRFAPVPTSSSTGQGQPAVRPDRWILPRCG